MGLYSGGLIIGRIFASEIWGAYFREGLFLREKGGGAIIGILRWLITLFHVQNAPITPIARREQTITISK